MKSLVFAIAVLGAVSPISAQAGTVKITLHGVESRGGEMLVGLQKEADFLQPRGTNGAKQKVSAAGTMTITLEDVPPGTYSFSALHDQNGDQQMQFDAEGRPAEGWAMHKGDALRGRPTWADVKFTVADGVTKLDETMIYPKP